MLKDYCIPQQDGGSEEEFVGEFWDARWQQAADDLPARQRKVLRDPYYPHLKTILLQKPGGRVLDCGCGMGEWTLQLNEEGFETVGIDIATRRIEALQARFGEKRFRRGSFLQTGFEPDSFDVLFNWGGAEHFEEGLQPAFREAFRLLKPGGYFLASSPAQNLRHMLRGFLPPPPESCAANRRFYQYRFARAEFAAELAAAGFRVEKIAFLDSREGVVRFLNEEGRWLARLGLGRLATAVGGRLLPGWLIGHMILGIGQKPSA